MPAGYAGIAFTNRPFNRLGEKMNELDEYLARRRMVWCSAYAAAFTERWGRFKDNPLVQQMIIRECLEIAGAACASFPAPGEKL